MATIEEGDVVIFFNFRTDRGRELTSLNKRLAQKHAQINLYYVTLTNYDETYKNVKVVYNKDNITETLGSFRKANKTQIRIAETEKYPHVTFSFQVEEEPFIGESRILKTLKSSYLRFTAEMSAFELTDALIPELEKGGVDFVCLNFEW
jgi:2,3-bisphosphoglycerate-independent phosphoglycerate mutase